MRASSGSWRRRRSDRPAAPKDPRAGSHPPTRRTARCRSPRPARSTGCGDSSGHASARPGADVDHPLKNPKSK
ncbi:hypothetical protein G6F46_014995 [Rhizopus delemar]|nr:hypothetical protein G6F46_014995 [Rhizopus delemar]